MSVSSAARISVSATCNFDDGRPLAPVPALQLLGEQFDGPPASVDGSYLVHVQAFRLDVA
jgi:hypothetical protein